MIDLHCHILPSLDDGPEHIEESIAMAKMAAGDGITHIVATPHFRYSEKPDVGEIRQGAAMVDNAMKQRDIPLTLMIGADIRLTYELLAGISAGDIPTINNSRYFLLELPDVIPPNLDSFLFSARLKGYVPIITHPERNYSLLSTPEKAETLKDSGVLFQITAMSITGDFGPQIKSFCLLLLKKGLVDFIATDAHNTGSRVPVLSRAYRETVKHSGGKLADKIFIENPETVICDREMPA